jgi:hypothetical protein
MERERNDAPRDGDQQEDATRGPDEAGIGAKSQSSPQGDGAEKAAPRRTQTEPPTPDQTR